MARTLAAALALLATSAATPRHVWVGEAPSPPGLGVERRYATLADAVGAATALPPTTIHLAPGRHALSAPLVLDRRHTGLRFVGHGTAAVSGGVLVGGPSPPAAANVSDWVVAGPAGCEGAIRLSATPFFTPSYGTPILPPFPRIV